MLLVVFQSPRELVFSAYKKEDILAILEQRLGSNIVDQKALQLISRRVAASNGDVRRALEITSNAVGKCMHLTSKEKLDMEVAFDGECMPLVKLPHMMRAIKEGMPMGHANVICSLPHAAKVVLCVAVSLSQVWSPTSEISISVLKKYCVEATHHAIMDELSLGHVMSLVEMLLDARLLMPGNSGQFNPHDPNAKIKIGVQLDDVEIALEQSLLKEGGFYKCLVDYVKRETDREGVASNDRESGLEERIIVEGCGNTEINGIYVKTARERYGCPVYAKYSQQYDSQGLRKGRAVEIFRRTVQKKKYWCIQGGLSEYRAPLGENRTIPPKHGWELSMGRRVYPAPTLTWKPRS